MGYRSRSDQANTHEVGAAARIDCFAAVEGSEGEIMACKEFLPIGAATPESIPGQLF